MNLIFFYTGILEIILTFPLVGDQTFNKMYSVDGNNNTFYTIYRSGNDSSVTNIVLVDKGRDRV